MNSGHYGGALIMERKIYALGGTETETNVVTNKSTMRYRPDVAALENKIYVTGGHCVGVAVSSVDFYDPDTGTWSQMANVNIARSGISLVSLHGRLCSIGGRTGCQVLQYMSVYIGLLQ